MLHLIATPHTHSDLKWELSQNEDSLLVAQTTLNPKTITIGWMCGVVFSCQAPKIILSLDRFGDDHSATQAIATRLYPYISGLKMQLFVQFCQKVRQNLERRKHLADHRNSRIFFYDFSLVFSLVFHICMFAGMSLSQCAA